MSTLAIDWDSTLVNLAGDWLDGAPQALHELLRDGHKLIIHSCRANWPEGLASIEHKLWTAGLAIDVWCDKGKPDADLYIGDNYAYFDGSWPRMLNAIRAAERPTNVIELGYRRTSRRAGQKPVGWR